jgi:hypothetical protein
MGEEGMADFANRREAFENKFAHDEALRFKAVARRNKLLGLWAAQQLGKSGQKPSPTPGWWSWLTSRDREEITSFARSSAISMRQVYRLDQGQVRRLLDAFMHRATNEIKAGI